MIAVVYDLSKNLELYKNLKNLIIMVIILQF